MSYAQFVDKIDASPTVRLDIDDGVLWGLQASGTEIGSPPVERAVVSSLLADGARIPASAYGLRTLQLTSKILASSDDDAATQVQKLARELDRPVNFLRWQPDTTNPVFFRLLRGEFADLRFDPVLKQATASVLAEPFAYGLRETGSPVTVYDDPAAVSNGMYLEVTGVKGDVETPAFIEYPAIVSSSQMTLLAVRRRGTPSQAPFLLQAESMTPGTDTSLQANDPVFSGSGQNWQRCSFATTTSMAKRLEITSWPATSGPVDYRGTYRVFVRVRRNDNTATSMALQLKWGESASIVGRAVTSWTTVASSNITLVDLGLLTFPTTADPVHLGPTGSEITVRGLTRLELHAQRVSGVGTLDIDYLLFVPADDTLLLVGHPTGASGTAVVDGYTEIMYHAFTGTLVNTLPVQVAGRFPMLSPGETNRIVFCRNVGAGPSTVTETTAVTVSYWPRYLHVRPAVE